MNFHHGRRCGAWIVILSLGFAVHPVEAQPKKPLDFHAVFAGYVRILCQDLNLEEAVRIIRSTPKIDPAIAKSYSLFRKNDLAGALATLDAIPKPIAKVPTRFLYWELRGHIQHRLGDDPAARRSVRELLTLGGTDTSRVELQAWKFLRELGEKPTEKEASRVLGVVVEVNTAGHLMAAAGYTDGNARFSNDAGVAILGDKSRFPKEIREAAEHLPRVSQKILDQVPLQGDCAAPAGGEVKFALLTPAGIHTKVVAYDSLQKNDHPLHELWAASNNLIEMSLNLYKKLADDRAHQRKPRRPASNGSSKSGPHR